MSDHDHLCPWLVSGLLGDEQCDLIAEVRADEREKVAQAIEAARGEYALRPDRAVMTHAARIARAGGALRAGSAHD